MTSLPSIRIEGGLLGPDVLDELLVGNLPGQRAADFGLDAKRNLTDEIAAAFADARALWGVFQHRLDRVPTDDLATTVTRDAWVIPFLGLLGYEPRYNQRAYEMDGLTFAISHGAGAAEERKNVRRGEREREDISRSHALTFSQSDLPPVHIVGARQKLGTVPASGRPRLAPHTLVQEYLNHTEHLWGLVTNRLTLRLLRDCTFVRRQAYVEFDLQATIEEQRFQDFAARYRLLHRTRLPHTADDADDCLLEKYYAHSVEQGGRVRDHLRDGVEQCITLLANGFLRHPANDELRRLFAEERESVRRAEEERENVRLGEREKSDISRSHALTFSQSSPFADSLYRQLLCLVYRFLFLLVSEDRGLLSRDPLYRDHYGVARLRRLLDQRLAAADHDDLWQSLRVLWLVLIKEQPQPALNNQPMAVALGLPVLNGELFAPQPLDSFTISNRDLLEGFWRLAWYQERPTSPPRRVNYAALDVEELGSVYESLLEFHPVVSGEERESVRRGERENFGVSRSHALTFSQSCPPITTETLHTALTTGNIPDARLGGLVLGTAHQQRFFHWPLAFPEVFAAGGFDVILGNPPFMGGLKISTNFGDKYWEFMTCQFAPYSSTADLCAAFFRRAFSALRTGDGMALIGTNTGGQGDTRNAGLAEIKRHGGSVTFARRFVKWPGRANVEVNLVALGKGRDAPANLDGQAVAEISSRLDADSEAEPQSLQQNNAKAFIGSYVLGMGFTMPPEEAQRLIARDPHNRDCLFPYLNGEDLNTHPEQQPSRWVINLFDWPLGGRNNTRT